MKSNGYGSYHGQSRIRSFLKGVIVLLLAVLIVAVGAFFFLQRYMVFSDQGIRLDLPFLQTPPDAPPAATDPLVVVSPPPVIVTPTPAPRPTALHAVGLPRAALSDGTALTQVKARGGNAALFDMMAPDGTLGYVSAQEIAISAKASSADPAVNAAIAALNETELYTVARVSCFKAHLVSDADRNMAVLTNSGYRWTDPENIRWISPTSEKVRQYVTAVCVELAELGFDEILLDNCGYPTQGNLGYIKKGALYDEAAFAGVIAGFYAQVQKALEPYAVKLSIVTDRDTLDAGANQRSGQTVAALTSVASRIWVDMGESLHTGYSGLLETAGLADAQENTVALLRQAGSAEDTFSWATAVADTTAP